MKIPLDKILRIAYILNMKVSASNLVEKGTMLLQIKPLPQKQKAARKVAGTQRIRKGFLCFAFAPLRLGVNVFGRVRVVMAVSGFALACIACENPFQTRTPEPPRRVQGTFTLPHAPEIVFINLRYALAELNVVNYERCFADSTRSGRQFRFIPEATVANTNPGLFARWGVKNERDYFARMRDPLPADSVFSLRLDSLKLVVAGDSATFFQRYELIARHQRQASGVPRKVSGEGHFWLSRDQFGDWSIYRWADLTLSSGGAFTWSTLKAAFAQ